MGWWGWRWGVDLVGFFGGGGGCVYVKVEMGAGPIGKEALEAAGFWEIT